LARGKHGEAEVTPHARSRRFLDKLDGDINSVLGVSDVKKR